MSEPVDPNFHNSDQQEQVEQQQQHLHQDAQQQQQPPQQREKISLDQLVETRPFESAKNGQQGDAIEIDEDSEDDIEEIGDDIEEIHDEDIEDADAGVQNLQHLDLPHFQHLPHSEHQNQLDPHVVNLVNNENIGSLENLQNIQQIQHILDAENYTQPQVHDENSHYQPIQQHYENYQNEPIQAHEHYDPTQNNDPTENYHATEIPTEIPTENAPLIHQPEVQHQPEHQPEQPEHEAPPQHDENYPVLGNQFVLEESKPSETTTEPVPVPTVSVEEESQEEPAEAPNDDPHTSILQLPSQNQTFATPSKSLPPLKDIDQISTPKSFSVARDSEAENEQSHVASSPIVQKNTGDLIDGVEANTSLAAANTSIGQFNFEVSGDHIRAVSGFLDVDESHLSSIDGEVLDALIRKSVEFQELTSQNSFLQLKGEQNIHKSTKLIDELRARLNQAESKVNILTVETENQTSESSHQKQRLHELEEANKILNDRINRLKEIEETTSHENKSIEENYEVQIIRLNDSINHLTSANIDQSKKFNQITKEINDTRNESFTLKLDLTKVNNEFTYIKNQKQWLEQELDSTQKRYTDLIKKHESEYLLTTNKVDTLTSQNDSLETINKTLKESVSELRKKLEEEQIALSKLRADFSSERSNLIQQTQNQEDLLKLTQKQGEQRTERIEQLESYIEEIKEKLGANIKSLEHDVEVKDEQLIELKEKLRRAEEVLDAELHKESELPKLTDSSSLIAAQGISLSTLYSEFNHLKKQLVLERSQKEKLAIQLESFVHELESKKPAIANYRDQVKFYETSLQEMIGKVESIRIEKVNAEKDSNRLRSRLIENDNDLASMKSLLKDLGRQLCYYLIHSKIRDNNEDPLTLSEKQAIESILQKSGNFDADIQENESDKLISERLLEFKSIIELREKNEELLRVVRILSKKLENKEEENNNIESVAIEEAKDAILTLEGELDSLHNKLDAVTKERDILKSTTNGTYTNGSGENNKYLSEANADLKSKLSESERILKDLQKQTTSVTNDLNNKIRNLTNDKNDLSLQLSSSKHSIELIETRYNHAQSSIEEIRKEIGQTTVSLNFWKEQASKQEQLLINKSNEVRDLESKLSKQNFLINNFETEKNYSNSVYASLKSEVDQLKIDKNNLNDFVVNLQGLLKQRDDSSKELSDRLNKSIENYQSLHDKLAEKDERISILTSQAELTLKSQSSKLEQVGEISQALLETKGRLSEKESQVESLKAKLSELSHTLTRRASLELDQSGGDEDPEKSGLRIEISQLKEDLKISESQVEELSNLAKASEEALVNATNSFEQYKIDFDGKYKTLLNERTSINDEISRLQSQLEEGSKQLEHETERHRLESNELKVQLDEYSTKAEAYDSLQKDYDSRLAAIRNDLEVQAQLASSNQNKYQEELQKNIQLSSQVVSYKEDLEGYKNQIQELSLNLEGVINKEEAFDLERSSIEDELKEARAKVEELKQQNSIVLNQLELSKHTERTTNDAAEDEDSLKEVVSYLRREKDAAELKLSLRSNEIENLSLNITKLNEELSRLKSQAANTSSPKKETLSLSLSVKEAERIEEHLEQFNILKESNTTLRSENKTKVERIQELEAQLEVLSKEVEPLKVRINQLSTDLDVSTQRVRLVEEEGVRLKARLQVAEAAAAAAKEAKDVKDAKEDVQAGSASPVAQAVPAESSESEAFQQMREKYVDLRNKANTRIQAQNDRIKELQDSVSSLNEEISKLQKAHQEQIEQLKKEGAGQVEELNSKLKSIEEEHAKIVSSLKEEKAALDQKLQQQQKEGQPSNFEEQLTNLKKEFEAEKAELQKTLAAEFESKYKAENGNDTRKQLEAEFQQKYAALEQSVNERKNALEQEYGSKNNGNESEVVKKHEEEIAKLKQSFSAELDEEREKTKKQVEKLFEVKIKMLNKKVERLERENAGSASKPSTANSAGSGASSFGVSANVPKPGNNAGKPKAKPLGYPHTESTLTVHRPAIDRGEKKQETPQPQTQNNNHGQNEKRKPFPQGGTAKKAKDS